MGTTARFGGALLGLGLALGGCGGDPMVARQLPADVQASAARLVDGNNGFALDLYRKLAVRDGNLFLSPFSISAALAMTYAGAAGTTQAEMARTLELRLGPPEVHVAFGALLDSLNRGSSFGGYRLDIANRLFGQAGFGFTKSFLATTREQYRAELKEVDFERSAETARATVNDWAAQQTEGKIRDLFPAGSVTADTTICLANAIYFKGDWASQFPPSRTNNAPFHLASGATVDVPMMTQTLKAKVAIPYANADDASVLELPFRGGDLAMIFLLPSTADGLPQLESTLTRAALDGWLAKLSKNEIWVTLPRFTVESTFDLRDTLSQMGMPSAFAADAADFSGMDGQRDLFLDAAVHKAYVKVDETGAEAAAASGFGGTVAVSMPASFVADRPFLFFIRDEVTRSILFVGRVADPSHN